MPDLMSAGRSFEQTRPTLGRRGLLQAGMLATAGAIAGNAGEATAQGAPVPTRTQTLNFLLNLAYLEAEFYSLATRGNGLNPSNSSGYGGPPGAVSGGSPVPFADPLVSAYAFEIANDKRGISRSLRGLLEASAVSRPVLAIDVNAFTNFAIAAGLIVTGQMFNPYGDDVSFLLGGYIFADLVVSAYLGALSFISDKATLSSLTGCLATHAYHASTIRSELNAKNAGPSANAISNLINTLANALISQGIIIREPNGSPGPNIIPTDGTGLGIAATQNQTLDVVYGAQNGSAGLFLPNGINPGPVS